MSSHDNVAPPMPPAEWPSVSVILPIRNEIGRILDVIDRISSQDYPGDLEIVVADAMSNDGTRARLEELANSLPNLIVVDNPDVVTPSGLNRAILLSRGEIIVRCDGHALFPPGYIKRAVAILKETGAANVGGIQQAVGTGPLQQAIALAMTTRAGVGNSRFHYGGEPGPSDTVYLGVFRRSVFDDVGLFDQSMIRNQDYELNYRIRKAGGLVYFHPDLIVEYEPRPSYRRLWPQYMEYGRFKRKMARSHKGSLPWRQVIPSALVAALFATPGLVLTPWPALGAMVPLTYSAFLVLVASGYLRRVGLDVSLRLPVALATMHLA